MVSSTRWSARLKTLRKFSKYQGAGNDFILFEDFEEDFPMNQIPTLCHRHFGIGADGLILIRKSRLGDFQMVFFNSDGSKVGMCGNGLRCCVHFLLDQGKKMPSYLIEIEGRLLTVKVNHKKISTFLGLPKVLKWREEDNLYLVDTGVAHLVCFAQEEVDVVSKGRQLRQDKFLHPEGFNVNFVWEKGGSALEVRTYEKGVEGETLACGTGAAAAAFVAHKLGKTEKRVAVHTLSKAVLEIELGKEIEVIGPSEKVFEGFIPI